MPIFTLTRQFEETWTDRDFEKMMRRAIAGLHWTPPVYWHRSYGIDQEGAVAGFCVYEADSLRSIQQQQRICWIPFTEAREVEEAYGVSSGPERYEPPEGMEVFLVERTFAGPMTSADLCRLNREAQSNELTWVRSFWDGERSSSRCIFSAPDANTVAAAILGQGCSDLTVLPVLEEHPSAWAEMYDQVGAPRSWEGAR